MNPKKITCLLIEEDLDDVEIFKMALNELPVQIEVVAFPDCESAIKLIETDVLKPNCVFLDAYQLRMKDDECLNKIKVLDKVVKAPVVILAADPTLIDESKYKEAPVAAIIYKESSLEKFKQRLHNFFSTAVTA